MVSPQTVLKVVLRALTYEWWGIVSRMSFYIIKVLVFIVTFQKQTVLNKNPSNTPLHQSMALFTPSAVKGCWGYVVTSVENSN